MSTPPTIRERIVEAALQIIGEDGVAAVTNRRIARQAGVSLGSITYHFATQHELLREALRSFVEDETRRFTELAEGCSATVTLQEAGAVVGQVAADTAFDHRRIAPFELYIQAGRDDQLRPAATECFAAYDRLAASILTALGVEDAERLAGPVVALVTGLQLRSVATGSVTDDLAEALLLLIGSLQRTP